MPIVRDARPEEIERLLELWDALERAQGSARIFPLSATARDEMRDELEQAFGDEAQRVIVADEDGSLVGMALASVGPSGGFAEETAVHLSRVVVDEGLRGSGIGRALIDAAAAWGGANGARWLKAWVFTGNAEALKVWDRLGFTDRAVQKIRPIT
jgi:GNAT superfamily N-acetyltransferase